MMGEPVVEPEPSRILFTPLTINGLTLSNRIVMSPMAALEPGTDFRPSEQTIAFLCERAKGGVGLIIVGGTTATRRGYEESPVKRGLRLDDDTFVSDLKRMTDAVHEYGTPVFVELSPGFGPMAKPSPSWQMIAASPKNVVMKSDRYPPGINIPFDRATATPREATIEEIREVERDMAAAAERARRAGFDGVEIPAMMNYLLASFLSPRSNWRTDEYGGSVENRARILVNIVRLIREQVGASFPVGLRILADQHVEGGQGPEGYAAIAQLVEREGLDYVALTDGNYESMNAAQPEAPNVVHGEAQVFRQALSCPLILGSIHEPQRAAETIAEGHADAVMLARPLIADPEYANKVRDGRSHDIVRCDRHNSCLVRLALGMPVRCAVNPRMGRESRQPGQRPPIPRLIKAPVEQIVVAAIGSERVMGLAGMVVRNR
jgi:2,4-dienoyl-CoA reductase-like NADH-dependent reductase (Old Yellow Enzyme family)